MGAAYVQGVLRYYCYYDYYGETAIALASLPGSLLLLLLLLLWGECHEGLPICRGGVLIAVIATIMGRLSWGCQAAGRYCFTLVIIPYGKEKMLFAGQLVL